MFRMRDSQESLWQSQFLVTPKKAKRLEGSWAEVFPLEHEVVIHPAPGRVLSCGDGIALERNERRPINGLDSRKILVAQIRLIRRDFGHVEVSGGLLHEWDEVIGIVGFPTAHVYASDDVSVHATHQMHLYPLPVVDFPPVLLVVPTNETGRGEAARVGGELGSPRL